MVWRLVTGLVRQETTGYQIIAGNSQKSICVHVYALCSAHRQDGSQVYYTIRSVLVPRWCTCKTTFSVFCYLLKNPRWPTCLFCACTSSWNSDGSNGIIYLGSILSVSWAKCIQTQASKWTNRIAYYSPAWAVARAGEKLVSFSWPNFSLSGLIADIAVSPIFVQ